jgi:UDP-GlcNAc:undecaprenyl-phosphate GlcNAc-1-phosphate transferase
MLKPIGFIDDDALKSGKKLQGYPIIGTFDDFKTNLKKYNVSGLLISIADQDFKEKERVKRFCLNNNLFLKQFSIRLDDVDLEQRSAAMPAGRPTSP